MKEHLQPSPSPHELNEFDGRAIHGEFVEKSRDLFDRKEGGDKKPGRHTRKHMEDKFPYGAPIEEHKAIEPGGQMELVSGNER